MVDTTVHGYLGVMVIAFAWYALAPVSADSFFSIFSQPGGPLLDIVLTVLLAALVGGFIVGATGTSLGKAIFGVKVLDPEMHVIGVRRGLDREMRVWFAGMGLGIPVIALFTMISAHNKLKADGITSWDSGKYIVLYRPNGHFQYAMNALGIVLIVVIFVLARVLNTP